uniref:Reverse transcriptase Ty1/copia-type domain-containing protein n=1 Tax=Moniliophthora roreri TaxID=221103 RepID=A0A0W0FZG2_MONRR
MAACHDELKSLQERNVYKLVDLPQGQKAIKSRWVFDVKTDGHYKARFVAKGFSQVEGIDYDELFSPVVRFETVRVLLALAALEDWDIQAIDVKTAFLYGELDKEIYMEQPQGFVKGSNKVWLLHRALYGLKQASLSWWYQCTKSMAKLGFKCCISDAGVYYFIHGNDIIIAIVYVDDVIFMGSNSSLLNSKKKEFMKI